MNILAIDTSTEVLGLCLYAEEHISTVTVKRGLKHSNKLLPWIQCVMNDNDLHFQDLDLMVYALGPGSFTGLRIGLSTLKGISFGSGCPLVGIPTLDSLAARFAFYNGLVLPIYDARKHRYYTAIYHQGNRISDYQDIDIPSLRQLIQHTRTHFMNPREEAPGKIIFTGPDASSAVQELQSVDGVGMEVDTGCLGSDPLSLMNLGKEHFFAYGAAPDTITPMYIRRSEAETIRCKNKQSVADG